MPKTAAAFFYAPTRFANAPKTVPDFSNLHERLRSPASSTRLGILPTSACFQRTPQPTNLLR